MFTAIVLLLSSAVLRAGNLVLLGLSMAGATNATLTIPSTSPATGLYFVIASNAVGTVASNNALLTVNPEIDSPVLIAALADKNLTNVLVSFSEAVAPGSVLASNFELVATTLPNHRLAIDSAVLTNGTNVLLSGAPRVFGVNYTARAFDITDVAANGVGATSSVPLRYVVELVSISPSNQWAYFQEGPLPAADWVTPGYDDAGWRRGASPFYVGIFFLPEPVRTSLSLSNATATERVTSYYFRTRFELPGTPDAAGLRLRYLVDDGAITYLNGAEVHALRMATNRPVSSTNFATAVVLNPVYEPPLNQAGFTVPATNFVPGDSVLAVEVHQATAGSSDVAFGLSAETTLLHFDPVPTLRLPATLLEGDGLLTGVGEIFLREPAPSNLTFTMVSSDTNDLKVPVTVIIPAGATNVMFDVTLPDDALLEGPRAVTLSAKRTGHVSLSATATILDNESTALTLTLPTPMTEGGLPGNGVVALAEATVQGVVVQLTSGDSTRLTVPSQVFIGPGQATATFALVAPENAFIDGPQTISVTAMVPGWPATNAALALLDNESAQLLLTVSTGLREGDGVRTNAGQVRLPGHLRTNLFVSLSSSDLTELSLPPGVLIPAGQSNAPFDLIVVNDSEFDGVQSVNLQALADGFASANAAALVADDDVHHFGFGPIGSPQQTGTLFAVTVLAEDVNGFKIPTFTNTVTLSASAAGVVVPTFAPNPIRFTNGQWGGSVVFTSAVPWARLVATRSDGAISESSPFDVQVPPFRRMALAVADVVHLATNGRLWATVTAQDVAYPNRLVEIDPVAGAVLASYAIGSDPGRLELTDDGQYLYVVVTNTTAVRRFDLSSRQVTVTIIPPTHPQCVPAHVQDLATVTGNPNLIVLANRFSFCSFGEIRVFDGAGYRVTGIPQNQDPQVSDLESLGVPGLMVGIQDDAFSRFQVSASGIAIQATAGGLIVPGTKFKVSSGLIYAASGQIVDPQLLQIVGSYPVGGSRVEIDPAVQRTIFVGDQSFPFTHVLRSYDQRSRLAAFSMNLAGIQGSPTRLTRWGTNGLAFSTGTELALVQSSELVPSLPPADLSVTQIIAPVLASGGSNFLCTIVVSNQGPNFASRVVVHETLPAGSVLLSSNVTAGGSVVQAGQWQWHLGDLPVGTSATGTLLFAPIATAVLTNKALTFSRTADTNFTNNVSIGTPSLPPVDLVLRQTFSPNPATTGGSVTYTLTLSNAGPNHAWQILVTDQLPGGTTVLSNSASVSSLTFAGNVTTWRLPGLPPGAVATATVSVSTPVAGSFQNLASVSSWAVDTNPADNTSSLSHHVGYPDLPDQSVIVSLAVTDMAYDRDRDRIVAAVGAAGGIFSNAIVQFDPHTGRIESTVSLGSGPGRIALSDNGQFLYVSLKNDGRVRRLNVPTFTTSLEFALDGEFINDEWYPFFAADLAVLPGQPEVVAAWRVRRAGSQALEFGHGIAVYDSGVMRSNVTSSGGIYALEFEAATGTLYAYDSGQHLATASRNLFRCAIDGDGVTFAQQFPPLGYGTGTDIEYASGRLFTTGGRAVNLSPFGVNGIFPGSEAATLVEPDAASGRVFFLAQSGGIWRLKAYDLDTFDALGSLVVSNVVGTPASLVRWGVDGLAFRTSSGQLHLLRSSLVQPGPAADLRVTLNAPTNVPNLGAAFHLSLFVTNQGPVNATSLRLTNNFPAGLVPLAASCTAGSCNVVGSSVVWTASSLAAGSSVTLTVTLSANSAGAFTSTAVLEASTPDPTMEDHTAVALVQVGTAPGIDSVVRLALPARDLTWLAGAGKILATMGPELPNWSNGLVSIAPQTGQVRYETPVGSGANRMALSDDGTRLYVGVDYAVQRIDTATLRRDLRFATDPLGFLVTGGDLAVAPGQSELLALARVAGISDVAVFDHGVLRNMVAVGESGQLEFGATADRLFALRAGGFSGGQLSLGPLLVDALGITALPRPPAFSPWGSGADFRFMDGRFYFAPGQVMDAELLTFAGSMGTMPAGTLIEADPTTRRILLLTPNGATALLQAFDATSLAPLGSQTVTGLSGAPARLTRWGADGLAFLTSGGQVFLLRTSLLPTNPPADVRLTLQTSPGPYFSGSNVTHTLVISNASLHPALAVRWSNSLPAGAVVVNATTLCGSIQTNVNSVSGTLGTLVPGQSCTATIVYWVGAPAFAATSAGAATDSIDLVSSNNAASALLWFIPTGSMPVSRVFPLATRDLVRDPIRPWFYASLATNIGGIGSPVVAIDPVRGLVGSILWKGGGPGRLAVSPDGQYLYIGLDDTHAVQRIHLPTGAADQRFPVPANGTVAELAVSPTNASLVVLRRLPGGRITLLENGVARPDELSGYEDLFAFSDTTGELYACNSFYSNLPVHRVGISESGLALLDSQPGRQGGLLELKFAGGLLHYNRGMILDPEVRRVRAVLSVPFNYLIEPDRENGCVFSLAAVGPSMWTLIAHSADQFVEIARTNFAGSADTPARLTRWGDDGIAFRTTTQLAFLRTALVPINPPADVALFSSVSAASAVVGAPLTISLSLTNAATNSAISLVVTQGFSLAVTGLVASPSLGLVTTSGGQITWRVDSLEVGAMATLSVQLQSAQAGTLVTRAAVRHRANDPILANNLALTVTPIGPPTNQFLAELGLTTRELVYDATRQRLYASIPATEPFLGNSIVVFDPVSLRIERCLFAGSEPNQLALSEDGHYLYVSLNGTMGVRRLDLTGAEPDFELVLGEDDIFNAFDLKVQPGHPQTIAASRVSLNTSGEYPHDLVMFDHAVQRPDTGGKTKSLAFSPDGQRVYGSLPNGAGFGFLRHVVSTQGLTLLDVNGNLDDDYDLQLDNGLLFSALGRVIDPSIPVLLSEFGSNSTLAPEVRARRIFLIPLSDTTHELRTYETGSFQLLGTVPLPGVRSYARHLTRCGGDRLAFRTDPGQQLFILRTPFAATPAAPAAELAVSQSATLDPTAPNDRIIFDVTVTNHGPGAVSHAVLAVLPPVGLAAFSLVPSQGSITQSAQGFTCRLGPLSQGGVASVRCVATVTNTAYFTNFASLTADVFDPDLRNNTSFASIRSVFMQPANSVQAVDLAVRGIVYDPVSGKLFASVAGNDSTNVARIDPVTVQVEAMLPVGQRPLQVAVSSDGQFLFAAVEDNRQITRVRLASRSIDGVIHLEPGAGLVDMAALPRQPLSLVIAQGGPEGTPSVLVYDDTVPRTNTVPSGYPFSLLETSVSGATVYAYGKGGNPWTEIYPLAVNAGGISVRPGSPPDLIFYYNYDMRFRGSRLYFASGHIVNPTGWVVEATLGGGQWVETDPTVTRVFYLGHDGGLNATLTAWSPATGQLIETREIGGVYGGVGSLVWCGGDRLAFHTSDKVYVVRTTQIPAVDVTTALVLSTNRVLAGAETALTAWVTNRGPVAATGVLLTNFLPAQASLVSSSVTQGSVSSGTNAVVAAFGTVVSNGVARLDLRLRFTNSTTFVATNRVQVKSSVSELFSANNLTALAFTVWSDNERDGLADDWEMEFFNSTNAPAGGAQDDRDGDGSTNLQEFLAGTDPSDATNLLRMTSVTAHGGTVAIQFHAVTGVRYQLLRAAALNGPWTPASPVVLGDGRRVTLMDAVPAPGSNWFFRIQQL